MVVQSDEETRELSGERDNTGARRRGRPRTAWIDNIKTWTGLPVEESVRMTRTDMNGESTSMMWPTLGSRTAKEQDRTARFYQNVMKFYIIKP